MDESTVTIEFDSSLRLSDLVKSGLRKESVARLAPLIARYDKLESAVVTVGQIRESYTIFVHEIKAVVQAQPKSFEAIARSETIKSALHAVLRDIERQIARRAKKWGKSR